MKGKRRWIISIAVIVMTSIACSMRSKQYNAPIVSGGLGLSRIEWEQIYGKQVWEDDFQAAYVTEKWRFMVDYYNGNVGSFKVRPSDDKPFPIELAREESRKFMPADSKFVETFMATGGTIIDLYYSDSLKGRFPPDPESWPDAKPGHFTVGYVKEYVRDNNLLDYYYIDISNTGR